MIKPSQTLHIKYTGEKFICKEVWHVKHAKNTHKQPVYWFRGLSYPIKEEQIQSALRGKRWEIIDNVD